MLKAIFGGPDSAEKRKNEVLVLKAAKQNDVEALQRFLQDRYNAPDDVRGADCRSLLHIAAVEGSDEALALLLQSPKLIKKLDSRDSGRRTALHLAAAMGFADCCQRLVEADAEMEVHDQFGSTPLHLAVRFSWIDAARRLLDLSADPFNTDKRGQSAIEIAIECADDDIVDLIEPYDAIERPPKLGIFKRCFASKRPRPQLPRYDIEPEEADDDISIPPLTIEKRSTRENVVEADPGQHRDHGAGPATTTAEAHQSPRREHAPAFGDTDGIELIDSFGEDLYSEEADPESPSRQEAHISFTDMPEGQQNLLASVVSEAAQEHILDSAQRSKAAGALNAGSPTTSPRLAHGTVADMVREAQRCRVPEFGRELEGDETVKSPRRQSSEQRALSVPSLKNSMDADVSLSRVRRRSESPSKPASLRGSHGEDTRNAGGAVGSTEASMPQLEDSMENGTVSFELAMYFDQNVSKLGFEVEWDEEEPLVATVKLGGESERRGFVSGDYIVELDGAPTFGRGRDNLLPMLKRRPLRMVVRRTVPRDAAHVGDPRRPRLELELNVTPSCEDCDSGLDGVTLCGQLPVVRAVGSCTEAAFAGVLEGDAILRANGRELQQASRGTLAAVLKDRPLALTVWRRPAGSDLKKPWPAPGR